MQKKRLNISFPIGRFSKPVFCENGDIWINHQDALYRIADGICETVLEYTASPPNVPSTSLAIETLNFRMLTPALLKDHVYLLVGNGRDHTEILYQFDREGHSTILAKFPWEYHELLASQNMLYLLGDSCVTLVDPDGVVIHHWEQPVAQMKNVMLGLDQSVLFLGQGPYCNKGAHPGYARFPICQAQDNGHLHTIYEPAWEDSPPDQHKYDVLMHQSHIYFMRPKKKKRCTEMQIRCFEADDAGRLAQTSFLRFRQNRSLADALWGHASISNYGLLFTDMVIPPQVYCHQREGYTPSFPAESFYVVNRLWICPLESPNRPQLIAIPVNELTRKCYITLPPLQTSDGTVFLTGSTMVDHIRFLVRWRNGVWSFRKFQAFEKWYLHHDIIYATHCWNKGVLYEIPQELGYKSL